MGYDCTLHLVDEGALARFVDRFLGRTSTSQRAPFDGAFADANEMVAKTKEILSGPDREAAGRALGELAMLYVSAETPHAYSRGFAMSLWDEDLMGAPMPVEGLGSVEALLGPIVEAYPAVRGQVPSAFTQNYCVGPFVGARDVPSVLAYVEKVLAAMVPGDRRHYLVLARVLRAAAARGMAYWEATDLGVAQAHADWLTADVAGGAAVQIAPCEVDLSRPRAMAGSRVVTYDDFDTHVADLSSFPPTLRLFPGFRTTAGAATPWGTWLIKAATDRTQRPFVFSLYEIGASDATPRPLDITLPWDLDFAHPCRDGVLLFPVKQALRQQPDARPLVLRAGGHVAALDLPPAKGRMRRFPNDLVCEAFSFGDGSTLVVWDDEPYRLDGDAIVPLGGGDLNVQFHAIQSSVAVSDDALVALIAGTPIQISRDGARETLLPLTNVQGIVRGPDGALILREGNNVEGDALKIWWPAAREVTSIQPDVFGSETTPDFVVHPSGPGLLVGFFGRDWRALPWDLVAGLPRTSEAQFLARHAELVARSVPANG